MVLLIGAALAVVSILILVYPFLKARIRAQPKDSPGGASGDMAGLEAIYQEISTLRLEYQLGKVTEDIYREQMRVYRLEAAVALREQAQAGGSALPDDPSEQDILAAQVALRSREGAPDRCPHCGAAVGREDRACAACTAPMGRGPEGNAP
jgi:hypothetical protein